MDHHPDLMKKERNFLTSLSKHSISKISQSSESTESSNDDTASSKSSIVLEDVSDRKTLTLSGRKRMRMKKFKLLLHWIGFCKYWANLSMMRFEKNIGKYISFALIVNDSIPSKKNMSEETLIKSEMMNFKKNFKELTESVESFIDDETRHILINKHFHHHHHHHHHQDHHHQNHHHQDHHHQDHHHQNHHHHNHHHHDHFNRTNHDIEFLKKAFKHMVQLKSINSLTNEMQTKFYRHCRLVEYDRNRVIVIQGQKPALFYLLFKGSLVCTFRKKYDAQSQTICFIEKGGTFGGIFQAYFIIFNLLYSM